VDKGLYVAMTGARQAMTAQQGHANNLANVNTTGFKADLHQARSMPVYGQHFPTRAYAMTENPATDFAGGSMIQTGRDLDVAVEGEGWLVVQAPDGNEAYTRDGGLQVDVNGVLRTASGLPVLGDGGPIVLPPASKMAIGGDGTISVIPLGAPPEEVVVVDRIRLVNPDPKELGKGPDGLIRFREDIDAALNADPALAGQPVETREAEADGTVRIASGFLETSNVNAVGEMTEIISLARQYEMQVKLMGTFQENSESSARLLQLS